ncbi:MAG TPA: aspartate dehydrogenase [Candidatus Thermoplasmatota archaeon]|nr:aspartate dehydrogenase [Candidatus Thermoplasmatota archaeon]
MRLLVLGCGTIGRALTQAVDAILDVTEVLCFDEERDVARALESAVPKARAVASLEEGLARCDLVVECASQAAVHAYAERVLAAGKDLVVLSVGALADDALRGRLLAAARASGRRIHVPSGALAGLDGVHAAAVAGLEEVVLTTSKPPAALGLPADLEAARVVFDGPAREAVARFPKNVNVAATLALAGLGLDRTRVRIVADPALKRNRHELLARGPSGEVRVMVDNEPFPENPRTSWLAALSAIALVRRLVSPLQIG